MPPYELNLLFHSAPEATPVYFPDRPHAMRFLDHYHEHGRDMLVADVLSHVHADGPTIRLHIRRSALSCVIDHNAVEVE